jgi:hypothetical protein
LYWNNARPHPGLLPRGEGESFSVSLKIRVAGFAGRSFAKPKPDCTVPSPGGEGQVEGGSKNIFLFDYDHVGLHFKRDLEVAAD